MLSQFTSMDWANKDTKFPSSEDGSQIFEVHCLFFSRVYRLIYLCLFLVLCSGNTNLDPSLMV